MSSTIGSASLDGNLPTRVNTVIDQAIAEQRIVGAVVIVRH